VPILFIFLFFLFVIFEPDLVNGLNIWISISVLPKEEGEAYRCIDFIFTFSDFDLEKEKSVLDEQGLRIAENQENSQKNRRKLAESTRSMHTFTIISKSWVE
jgi:hypothetical protein